MRAVIQRVTSAKVKVEDQIVGQIGLGLLVFIAFGQQDEAKYIEVIIEKIINLRIFENEEGKFDRSLLDVQGSLLIVSQFTLLGDCRKGRRPNFQNAASPEKARDLYELLLARLKSKQIQHSQGIFQAHMQIESVNNGPVTLILDIPQSSQEQI